MPMRTCFLVFVVILAIGFAGGLLALSSGVISFQASQAPSAIEAQTAAFALDASVKRHAPRQANPYPPTDENLLRGLNLYRVGCSECHGVPRQPNPYGAAFYPPVPQFAVRPPQRTEAEIYYVIKGGVRNTGMAAWSSTMTDEQIWKVAAFLSRMNDLPPAVAQGWNK